MKKYSKHILNTLLIFGSVFFIAEFFLHFFGLEPLEHDKIFIPTHDRYIALYALLLGTLLIANAMKRFSSNALFLFTMINLFFGMGVGTYIAYTGGYSSLFPVVSLDQDLSFLGIAFYSWYFLTWSSWLYLRNKK